MLLQPKPKLAQETRNNLAHLLPWEPQIREQDKFVHSFSLAVPLLGLSGGRARTDQVTDMQQEKALQDGSLPSCSKGAASLGKGNAFCRLGSTQHSLSRLSPLEQHLEQGKQPRLSTVLHHAVGHHICSTSQP